MSTSKLKRTVGLLSATSIGLGAMLGAGIFVFPGIAGGNAGMSAMISFLIGGVIATLVAACTAELATAMPHSGGGYFFVSRTFGPFFGTITGIAQWIGLIFACSFYLISFGEYALSLLNELGVQWGFEKQVYAFVFVGLLLLINLMGTDKVGKVQNALVLSLTTMLLLIFSYGLFDYLGIDQKAPANASFQKGSATTLLSTTALIFTSYLGFLQIANLGAEVKQPRKNLPRSLIGSVVMATVAYVFIIFVCTLTFPYQELKAFGETATIEVARNLLGKKGAVVVVCAAVLAALSSANASMISASRGVFALSRDRVITKKAAKVNRKFRTPHIALLISALPMAVLILRNELQVFAEVASFLHLLIYAGMCLSIIKLRKDAPAWYKPSFHIPWYGVIGGVGAFCCLALVFFMQSTSILIGLGIVAAIGIYYWGYVKPQGIELSKPNPPYPEDR